MPLIVVLRVDASIDIGTGHVMRCLTLAQALQQRGFECHFLCREHEGHLIRLIRDRGYIVHSLPQIGRRRKVSRLGVSQLAHACWLGTTQAEDARTCIPILAALRPSWLVMDHYALDVRWESVVRNYCRHLMVIDDLADRVHDCDLLLDQNLGRAPVDYDSFVPHACVTLIGPKYALLRPAFAQLRAESLARRKNGELHRLLIAMGGVDKDNATGLILTALQAGSLPVDCRLTVVMGPYAPWLERVRQQAAGLPWRTDVLVNVRDMARLMADSDLAIGAAGATSWERCCLGVPTILLVLAENQRSAARALARAGAATLFDGASVELEQGINRLIGHMARNLSTYGNRASQICAGQGTGLVLDAMERRIAV